MREWIVTNGLGGYASLTNQQTNTRKFHGLLVSSLHPPTERWVFLTNIFDTLTIGNNSYALYEQKNHATFDLFPSFTYHLEGTTITKTIFMEYGKDTTIIKYEIITKKPVSLTHSIIANSRHFYDVNRQRYLSFSQDVFDGGVRTTPSNSNKTLTLLLEKATYEPSPCWMEFFYQTDRERQDSWIDNNVHLGDFHKKIARSVTYYLVASLEDTVNIDFTASLARERKRKESLLSQTQLPNKFDPLVLSSDNFIVQKGNGTSIVAGYHWFGDWGRDTLISLPGLTLITRRFDDAQRILSTFAEHEFHGLIPNAFMERDSHPIYNAVDVSLWFIDRVCQYLKYSNDSEFLEMMWPTMTSIIEWYKKGTEYHIHMDHDFLISHDPGLTWMDVKIGEYYPTPRAHKAVEIQALWYNALKSMAHLSSLVNADDQYADLADQVRDSFLSQYDQCYDVIDIKDTSCRPNQLFLVSLEHSMIDKHLQQEIVSQVQDRLVAPFGIRTLSPGDASYKGSYLGNYNKDIAYHNGTVWPWLLGPFLSAFVKVKKREQKWRRYAYRQFLQPMLSILGDSWDGSIHEIFDGDPLYLPRGCIAQAWSVAEILRAWVEDVENLRPSYENTSLYEVRV